MKKLAVLMMIPALAIFVVPALASADDQGYGIKGLYAVTGFSTCLPAGSSGIFEADYTFNNDGTGSATQGVVHNIDASGGWSATFEATFTYEVTHEGKITFGYPWHGLKVYRTYPDGEVWWLQWDAGPSHGVISPDGKTITITCGPPVKLTVVAVSDNAPPIVGMQAFCVTTAMGLRLK